MTKKAKCKNVKGIFMGSGVDLMSRVGGVVVKE